MTPLTYVLVLGESCCSREQNLLSDPVSEEEIAEYLDDLRSTEPQMVTMVECYHM